MTVPAPLTPPCSPHTHWATEEVAGFGWHVTLEEEDRASPAPLLPSSLVTWHFPVFRQLCPP